MEQCRKNQRRKVRRYLKDRFIIRIQPQPWYVGEILPYEVFQLFTDTAEVKKIYVFPYPFRDGWERPLYFSFVPTEAALEEMRKYVERKWEEMCRTIREKDKSFDTIIPKVEMWEG